MTGASMMARKLGLDLLDACKYARADDARCLKLLDDGASLEEHDAGGTPLIWCAYAGHAEILRALLAKGADVNACDINGVTALAWAAERGHAEIIEILLSYKAPVNAMDDQNSTPLIEAAKNGHRRATAVLLSAGADIGIKDSWDMTAHDRAAQKNFTEVCGILEKHRNMLAQKAAAAEKAMRQINGGMRAEEEVPVLKPVRPVPKPRKPGRAP